MKVWGSVAGREYVAWFGGIKKDLEWILTWADRNGRNCILWFRNNIKVIGRWVSPTPLQTSPLPVPPSTSTQSPIQASQVVLSWFVGPCSPRPQSLGASAPPLPRRQASKQAFRPLLPAAQAKVPPQEPTFLQLLITSSRNCNNHMKKAKGMS